MQVEEGLQLTGNPFVDTGIAVVGVLRGYTEYSKLSQLSISDCQVVHGDGSGLALTNERLKSITMWFTTNLVLKNPAIKSRSQRRKAYAHIVTALLDEVGRETFPRRCEACGNSRSLDLTALYNRALEIPHERQVEHNIGREWFPLAGSLGSDAQALPSASRGIHLCAKCLFFVQYAPLASILYRGRLAVFQSTSNEFWYSLVTSIVKELHSKATGASGSIEIPGKGGVALERHLWDLFAQMKDTRLPEHLEVFVWMFTNSGTSPECQLIEIPNFYLRFLYELGRRGLANDALRLGRRFLACAERRQDYSGLYPWKGKTHVSPKLYTLYQSVVMGCSTRSLAIAYELAKKANELLPKKTVDQLKRRGGLRDPISHGRLRPIILQMAGKGQLTLQDYLSLFPRNAPTKIDLPSAHGWNIINYYMNHPEPEADPSRALEGSLDGGATEDASELEAYASAIYIDYVNSFGRERFAKILESHQITPEWLRRRWIDLARKQAGFDYYEWRRIATEGEKPGVWVTLFELELLWARFLHDEKDGEKEKTGFSRTDFVLLESKTHETELSERSGLVEPFRSLFIRTLMSLLERVGIERFGRLVDKMVRGEIGLSWFRSQVFSACRDIADAEDVWESSLSDAWGRLVIRERLFQMQLYLANFYRVSKVVYVSEN